MSDIYKHVTKDNKFLKILYDEDPCNPRDWDNLGTMVCFHRRYNLGDKHDVKHQDFGGWDEMKAFIVKEYNAAIVLPLYLYDHSGITMNTTGFHCPWDSGQVGFIYISKEKIIQEYGGKYVGKKIRERVTQYLINEVAEYDKYLRGDVFGFQCGTIENEQENVDEQCYGFLGSDFKSNGLIDELPEEYRELVNL